MRVYAYTFVYVRSVVHWLIRGSWVRIPPSPQNLKFLKMDRKFVDDLGWKHEGVYFANREIFSQCDYTIVEHNGFWYIPKDDDMYFVENVNEKVLREFTDIVKTKYEMESHANDYTLAEYKAVVKRLDNFYERYGYNEEEEDFDLY